MSANQYPPKNRLDTELPVLQLEVWGMDNKEQYDPNGFAVASMQRRLGLGEPVATSILSGQPAFLYRSLDLEIPLTRDELLRLGRHELRPDEYFKLRDHYGMFHEIHNDFYDEETGEALQPMSEDEAEYDRRRKLH